MVAWVGSVVKEAVGERASDPFVEEEKEQGGFEAFVGEAIAVMFAVALEQAVSFEFAQVVA